MDAIVTDKLVADSQRPENRFSKVIYDDDWTFTYHAIQQEEVESILDLLLEARPAFFTLDDEIIGMIHEEARAYYNDQKSVEDVANIIQNRVSLYVSENIKFCDHTKKEVLESIIIILYFQNFFFK